LADRKLNNDEKLETRINNYLKEIFSDNIKEKLHCESSKVIHDPILGTNEFSPMEINVIDTLLMQRLRRIHQTSLAFLTFPSATHTRFEHSLGVTIRAYKIAKSLKKKEPKLISDKFIKELRMASLLHDCGHFPFSHVSELLLRNNDEIKLIKTKYNLQGVKPHEIMSYLIVNSDVFQAFLQELKKICKENFSTKHLGDMIVGKPFENKNSYKSQILNGAIDADKLDYIIRDSYTTGLELVLDIERLLYRIIIIEKENKKHLGLDLSGISPLEQILFSKMLLFSNMYHHQKVRASDCMAISLLEIAIDEDIEIDGHKFSDPVTLIKINDYDLLSYFGIGNGNNKYKKYLKRILERDIIQRVFYLSMDSCEKNKESNYSDFSHDMLDYEKQKEFRKLIANKVGNGIEYYDIWVDFPNAPKFSEASQFEIKTPGGFRPFSDIFPIDSWLDAYNEIRYRGHLFCPIKYREKVAKAFKETLQEKEYRFELNSLSWEMCKWKPK